MATYDAFVEKNYGYSLTVSLFETDKPGKILQRTRIDKDGFKDFESKEEEREYAQRAFYALIEKEEQFRASQVLRINQTVKFSEHYNSVEGI